MIEYRNTGHVRSMVEQVYGAPAAAKGLTISVGLYDSITIRRTRDGLTKELGPRDYRRPYELATAIETAVAELLNAPVRSKTLRRTWQIMCRTARRKR